MSMKRSVVATFLVTFASLAAPADAHAGSCGSIASISADLWAQYGEVAKKVGCATAAVASEGTVPFPECLKSASKFEETLKHMISFWNDKSRNGWATIGPRRIDFGETLEGTVISTGGRVFLSAAPVEKDDVELSLKKISGKARAEVTVCRLDHHSKPDELWSFMIDSGDEDTGKIFKKTLKGLKGHILSVHIDAKSFSNKMKYEIRADKR